MDKYALQSRTRSFHIKVIKLCEKLPKNVVGYEIGKQLIKSAGSVGANYRAACRAKSRNDFIYKIEVVLEEVDESHYWLEVLDYADLIKSEEVQPLIKEANELISIFNQTDITAKRNRKISKSRNQQSKYDQT